MLLALLVTDQNDCFNFFSFLFHDNQFKTILYSVYANQWHVLQVDISNQDHMSSFKDRLQSLPSVAGIVHTAMVLRDEFIKDLTFQSFTEVMGPKIKGKIVGICLFFYLSSTFPRPKLALIYLSIPYKKKTVILDVYFTKHMEKLFPSFYFLNIPSNCFEVVPKSVHLYNIYHT